MKKIIAILVSVLTLSLTACSQTDNNSSSAENSSIQRPIASAPESSSSQTDSSEKSSLAGTSSVPASNENGGSKILIAYFTAAENSGVDAVASASYSMVNGKAVGRLRAIADMIQVQTGGDLFSIRTATVYPYNAYHERGFSDNEIEEKLHLEIPDNEYYNSKGIYNYHSGGNIVFDNVNVLNWITSHSK